MIKIKNSIYFTNHLEQKEKIDNKIIDYELEIPNKKLYANFTFIASDLYVNPKNIGDLVERIEYKYQINDNNKKSIFFVIDNIEYLTNNRIKVFCKTKGIKYTEKYAGVENKIIPASSLKDLLNKLLFDIDIDIDNLSDIPFNFDYTIENKSIDIVVNELSKITDFDFYFNENKIIFEDKKIIKKDDEEVAKFNEIEDIESLNTATNKDNKKINTIYINLKKEKIIAAEPQIVLDIKDSPQCCSPDEVKIYTDDDGNTYKISPVNSFYIIYYSPLFTKPITNLDVEEGSRIVVEKFRLENDNYITLTGGIDELIDVEGVEEVEFKKGYNIVTFKQTSGDMKISYKTNVLYGTFKNNKYPKNVSISIKHFNQILEYTHKYELNGYYPIPFTFNLNLISDWGIDSNEAINKKIIISRKKGDVFIKLAEHISDNFGDIYYYLDKYGTYRFDTENYNSLYLDWYINKKELKMDEIKG